MTPFTLTGLGVQLASGSLMFVTSAMKFTENGMFGIKIGLVIAAVAYHFGIHRKVALAVTPRRAGCGFPRPFPWYSGGRSTSRPRYVGILP